MHRISNNLIELNGKKRLSISAETLLQRLGFTLKGSEDIFFNVDLPNGWTHENQGQFHNVFHGPNGEEVWSFIKYDPWDRHSFLQARGISEDTVV